MDNASTYIDWNIFSQILEMDEDPILHEFSSSIIQNYFEQAESTFDQMATALSIKNLEELSSLGHFLKGSSAALGLTKVQNSCEQIQHFGARKDKSGLIDVLDDEVCLESIKGVFGRVKGDYEQTRVGLMKFFAQQWVASEQHKSQLVSASLSVICGLRSQDEAIASISFTPLQGVRRAQTLAAFRNKNTHYTALA